MRTLWAIVVVCLVAATGVAPVADAASADDAAGRAPSYLGDARPALPAVTAARQASVIVANRPRPALKLPPVVLAAPPALIRRNALAIVEAPRRLDRQAIALLPIRSARGPPVR
jgi:hypothetical protein